MKVRSSNKTKTQLGSLDLCGIRSPRIELSISPTIPCRSQDIIQFFYHFDYLTAESPVPNRETQLHDIRVHVLADNLIIKGLKKKAVWAIGAKVDAAMNPDSPMDLDDPVDVLRTA